MSGSNSTNLYAKKAVFGGKNRALSCALLENCKCVRQYLGTGIEIKIPTNLGKPNFCE
jgi:hypothetical protein